jgi:hypothetical protein
MGRAPAGISLCRRVNKEKILHRILQTAKDREIDYTRLHRHPWPKRLAAAAAVILLIATAWFFIRHPQESRLAERTKLQNDAPPATKGAVLTLAGGRQILLDSTQTGELARDGHASIRNQNGQLDLYGRRPVASHRSGNV